MAGTRERKEHRLKLFVDHYLVHGRADSAAVAAGYKGGKASLQTVGSRLLREVESRGLMDKARKDVLAKVRKGTIASLDEALGTATVVLRGRLGKFITEDGAVDLQRIRKAKAGLVRKYEISESMRQRRGEDVEVWDRKTRFEMESSLSAAKTLIDFYAPKEGDQPKTPPLPPVTINILGVLKDENVRTALIGAARGYHLEDRSRGNGVEP